MLIASSSPPRGGGVTPEPCAQAGEARVRAIRAVKNLRVFVMTGKKIAQGEGLCKLGLCFQSDGGTADCGEHREDCQRGKRRFRRLEQILGVLAHAD